MKYLHKFSATWCQPCRMLSNNLKPILTDLEASGVTVVEYDVDLMERPELARLGVRSVPTLILMDESGVELSRQTGALTADDIRKWLGLDCDAIPSESA